MLPLAIALKGAWVCYPYTHSLSLLHTQTVFCFLPNCPLPGCPTKSGGSLTAHPRIGLSERHGSLHLEARAHAGKSSSQQRGCRQQGWEGAQRIQNPINTYKPERNASAPLTAVHMLVRRETEMARELRHTVFMTLMTHSQERQIRKIYTRKPSEARQELKAFSFRTLRPHIYPTSIKPYSSQMVEPHAFTPSI